MVVMLESDAINMAKEKELKVIEQRYYSNKAKPLIMVTCSMSVTQH